MITDKYFKKYQTQIDFDLAKVYNSLSDTGKQVDFEYLIEASAVYSSNIEGNSMDLNSFMNSKMAQKKSAPKEYQEIVDLIEAYKFAQEAELNEENLLKSHGILSQKFLIKNNQGQYRQGGVGVFDNRGLVYMAVEPENVQREMSELFNDINNLLKKELTVVEIFYYASFVHLHFAMIHPFADGNGRVARLLEKWFIAKKLDEKAWTIQSEKYYKENLQNYYKNINLGVNYYEVDYDRCMPFLIMLIESVK